MDSNPEVWHGQLITFLARNKSETEMGTHCGTTEDLNENAENPPQAGFVWKKRREGGESIYDFPRDDKKQLTLRYDFYELK